MNRRGLFKWTLDNLNMDLQCMTFISRASSNILVGGLQPSMLTINIERGSVVDKLVFGSYISVFFTEKLI